MNKKKEFVHLHIHSEFSKGDGAQSVKAIIDKAKKNGQKAIAITDHGTMGGVIDFYKYAKEVGVKPIIGMEAYITNDENGEKNRDNYHLILLAKNKKGYENLMKMASMSSIKGFYYKPRVSKKMLKEYRDGIIALSGCLAGEVPFHLRTDEKAMSKGARGYKKAKSVALEHRKIFGKDFYIEIMRHGLKEQKQIDKNLIKISRETGIKLVATNDAHYTNKKDAVVQRSVVAMARGVKLCEIDNSFPEEFYIKDTEEMKKRMTGIKHSMWESGKISDKCNVEIELGEAKPPKFKKTREEDDLKIRKKTMIELVKRKKDTKKYVDRLNLELEIITKMGFSGYLLIIEDAVKYAEKKNIMVGPGRGSAAGSLAVWLLGITKVDPIKFNLLFERFLNPERISMPDIDIDVSTTGREDVIDYLSEKYGKEKVARIKTFSRLGAKGAIRASARLIDKPVAVANKIAKEISFGESLESAEYGEKILELKKESEDYKQVFKFAKKIEGTLTHDGIHAAGVVLHDSEVWNKIPIEAGKTKGLVTQIDMKNIENAGLIKFDFLGLRNLTIIEKAVKEIEKKNKKFDINSIKLDDKKVFKLLKTGFNIGVFQLESQGMSSLAKSIDVSTFEELVALLALYRPGPMESGMVDMYIKRKRNKKLIKYDFKELKCILKGTYGVIVYQEQVLEIVKKIGGFSLGEADIVRRAMGKKNIEELMSIKEEFVKRAVENGHEKRKVSKLFETILKFAGYGFNRSHSVAYGLIAYQTAYLKANYKKEFVLALLNLSSDKESKIKFLTEAKRMNIRIREPDINKSGIDFTPGKGDEIFFGLKHIIGVGQTAAVYIDIARKKKFRSIEDMLGRVNKAKVNKRVVKSLIESNALKSIGVEKGKVEGDGLDIEEMSKESELKIANEGALLYKGGNLKKNVKSKTKMSKMDKIALQKKTLGIVFSEEMDKIFKEHDHGVGTLTESRDALVFIEKDKIKVSKRGVKYMKVTLFDNKDVIEAMVFSEKAEEIDNMNLDYPVHVRLRLEGEEMRIKEVTPWKV